MINMLHVLFSSTYLKTASKTPLPKGAAFHAAFAVLFLVWFSGAVQAQTFSGNFTIVTQADVDAFNYTIVTGNLIISGNATNLNGLSELTSVGGNLEIYNNSGLTSLTGLGALTSVGGKLEIYNNASLGNLTGLGALTSLMGELRIFQNASMTSLTGLGNISPGTITNLFIMNNSSLSTCAVLPICAYLAGTGTATISGNLTNCGSVPVVEAACALLPVELIDFQAISTSDQSAMLTWRTASEFNNAGFETERSMDGTTWKILNFIPGNGTTQAEQSYKFVDERPLPGTNYYRLRQVDFDGRFEYSKVVSIKFKSKDGDAGTFYPNPSTSGVVQLDYFAPQDGDIAIVVFDVSGKLVFQNTKPVSNGENQLSFDFSKLNAGVYIVEIGDKTHTSRRKLIIER